MIPYSLLDLSPVPEGSTPRDALDRSAELARHAERLGFRRYWVAEHHNMPGIASAATAVVIAHVAAATSTIRVGAGGIMLPNHAPLVIAEQFGTLATLHPGRIDLGLGRAPGTDMMTARALRRSLDNSDNFPQDVLELMAYFEDVEPNQRVQAVPGGGTHVPVWILGSSLFGAQLAAHLGLPYAFASHFAPAALEQAIEVYRQRFQPSATLERPYFMLAANVFGAETDSEARYLATSLQQSIARLRSGQPGLLPPPVDDVAAEIGPGGMAMAEDFMRVSAVGSPETVERELGGLLERYRPDEILLTGMIHDRAKALRSVEIAADAMQRLGAAPARAEAAE